MTGWGAKSHAEAAATTCPHLRPTEQQTRPGRHNTSTTPNPRLRQSPQTQAAATASPKNQTKKNSYKYQQRPWYSVQRWRECQRSIIYAARRKVVRSDSACRRSGGLFEEAFGSGEPLIRRDSMRQEQLDAENCFKRQNPVLLWHRREVCRRRFCLFLRDDVKKKKLEGQRQICWMISGDELHQIKITFSKSSISASQPANRSTT